MKEGGGSGVGRGWGGLTVKRRVIMGGYVEENRGWEMQP